MKYLLITTLAFIALSCTSTSKKSTDSIDIEKLIAGRWEIVNIVFSDTEFVRPSDEVPGSMQSISFDSDTYFIQTNCNTISGSYSVSEDTITLGDAVMTEMACDNMTVEDALRRVIPCFAQVDAENDSTLRFNFSSPQSCLLLRRL